MASQPKEHRKLQSVYFAANREVSCLSVRQFLHSHLAPLVFVRGLQYLLYPKLNFAHLQRN